MAVVDARVRVHHPCPYCDISVEFPRTLLLLWCDNRRDVFLIAASDAPELRRILAALKDAFHARPLVVDGSDGIVEVPDFEWAHPPSITGLARSTGVWALHPVVYFEGTETYRFVAPSRTRLHQLIDRARRLGDVEILSVTDRQGLSSIRDPPVASVHFFEGLTPRQIRSLVAAYEGGLLDVPTRARWADVARREGLSRSTFGEHLRKAQHRLLANSYAALKSRETATSEPMLLRATGGATSVHRSPLKGVRTSTV
ncbi:MAG: helix-turn-helix domain-containing protein [Thermoplasmata archaeon]